MNCIHVFLVCFGSGIKEQGIFTCSALVSVHGLKNNFDFCVARFFSIHGLKTSYVYG